LLFTVACLDEWWLHWQGKSDAASSEIQHVE
jgi:hypothetical protein